MGNPVIDYTSRDFAAIKADMLTFAAKRVPEWTSRSEGSVEMLILELMAYQGDISSYYVDRSAMEAYLPTATQRLSLLNIAALLGYVPHNPVPAQGTVRLVTPTPSPAVSVPAGTQVMTDFNVGLDTPIIFETDVDATVPQDGDPEIFGRWVEVPVTHGQTRKKVNLATSTGEPDQFYQIPDLPVIDGTVKVYTEGLWGDEEWVFIQFLVDADLDDKFFSTYTDAAGSTWIRFGDGTNGLVPPIGTVIKTTYRVGGGVVGNLDAAKVTSFVNEPPGQVTIALNPAGAAYSSAMTGGADAESNDAIRVNARMAYRTQDRAVTAQDFTDLALNVPGVVRSKAVANHYTSVTLYITGPGATNPSLKLQDDVRTYFSRRTLAGVSLSVTGPTLVPVNFGTIANPIVIVVRPSFSRPAVVAEVKRVLQQMFDPTTVQFGMLYYVSAVYKAVASILGVQDVSVSVMARADQAQQFNSWVQMRDNELPILGTINLSATGGIG